MTIQAIQKGQGTNYRNEQGSVNRIMANKNGHKNTTETSYQAMMQRAMMAYRK